MHPRWKSRRVCSLSFENDILDDFLFLLWSFVSNFERHKLRKVHRIDAPSTIQSTSYQTPCYSGSCLNLDLEHFPDLPAVSYRGGSMIFFRRGCTRLLLYFNTNKPHSFFFRRIPVKLENRRSSRGGGGMRTPCTLPPDLPLCWDQQIGTSNTCDSVAVVFVNLWRISI